MAVAFVGNWPSSEGDTITEFVDLKVGRKNCGFSRSFDGPFYRNFNWNGVRAKSESIRDGHECKSKDPTPRRLVRLTCFVVFFLSVLQNYSVIEARKLMKILPGLLFVSSRTWKTVKTKNC